jgi:hypothetical protein
LFSYSHWVGKYSVKAAVSVWELRFLEDVTAGWLAVEPSPEMLKPPAVVEYANASGRTPAAMATKRRLCGKQVLRIWIPPCIKGFRRIHRGRLRRECLEPISKSEIRTKGL